MNDWLNRNRENLIFAGIALAVISGLLAVLYFSGYGYWIGVLVRGIATVLIFLLGVVVLLLPVLPGWFAKDGADKLDEWLGNEDTSLGMKAVLIIVAGLGLSVLYVFFVNALTYYPPLAALYIGDVAEINEVPLSAWGWIVWAFVLYIIAWGARWLTDSDY